jgi:hypothetical protein
VLSGLEHPLPGVQGFRAEADVRPQSFELDRTPDLELSLLVGDGDDGGGEVRDAPGYLQEARAYLLSLQAGTEDLAGLVEG